MCGASCLDNSQIQPNTGDAGGEENDGISPGTTQDSRARHARLAGRARLSGPICPRRAFLAYLALHAPRSMDAGGFFQYPARSLSDIAVRDEAKEVRPDARPQAWKNWRCIRWNTLRIFSGRERRRWSRIVRRSRKVNVGQAPRTYVIGKHVNRHMYHIVAKWHANGCLNRTHPRHRQRLPPEAGFALIHSRQLSAFSDQLLQLETVQDGT